MKLRGIVSVILLAGLVSACSSADLSKEHDFDEWVGRSKRDVIAKFGQPAFRRSAPDGSEQLMYATGHHTSAANYPGNRGATVHHQCNYRFVTDSNNIVQHAFRTGECRYEKK